MLAGYSKCIHDDLCPTAFPIKENKFLHRWKEGTRSWCMNPYPAVDSPAQVVPAWIEDVCRRLWVISRAPIISAGKPSAAICKPNGVQWMDQEQRDKTCIWESTLEILKCPDGQVQPLRELLQQGKLKISWKGVLTIQEWTQTNSCGPVDPWACILMKSWNLAWWGLWTLSQGRPEIIFS